MTTSSSEKGYFEFPVIDTTEGRKTEAEFFGGHIIGGEEWEDQKMKRNPKEDEEDEGDRG